MRLAGVAPEEVAWRVGGGDLFADGRRRRPEPAAPAFGVPREFLDLAARRDLHRDEAASPCSTACCGG